MILFAFPLHPAGKPSVARAEHLNDIKIPMLFLQGSADALAELDLLRQTVDGLGDRATVDLIVDADHAFHVPKRAGRQDPEVLVSSLAMAAEWMVAVAASPSKHV